VFTLPSVFDPMPHAALEAMTFEIPVIVSTGCGTVELIEDGANGLVVPPNDVDRLTDALLRLLQNEPLRRTVGAAGAATVRSSCYWPDVAAKVALHLQEVSRAVTAESPATASARRQAHA
jgi:glycosyltransferase involved in cell wall biosynthesis